MPQLLLGTVVPDASDPFVQQVLQLRHAPVHPARLVRPDLLSGGDGRPGCHRVPGEQTGEHLKRAQRTTGGARRPRRGRLQADAQALAHGQVRRGDTGRPPVEDECLGDGRRTRRGGLDPVGQGHQPPRRPARVGLFQQGGPARAQRPGHGHLGQQHRQLHRPVLLRVQHGGQHAAARLVQRGRHRHHHRGPVLAHRADRQAGGGYLHPLRGPQRGRRATGPAARGGGARRATRRLGRIRQRLHQPVQRRTGRQPHLMWPLGVRHDPLRQLDHLPDGGLLPAPAPAPAQSLQHGGHHPLVRPPGRRRAPQVTFVDQPPQALPAVDQPHPLHRGPAHPGPAQPCEFPRLGRFPLRQSERPRVVLGPWRAASGAARQPGLHLADVPQPGQSPLLRLQRHRLPQHRGDRLRGGRVDHREAGRGHQTGSQHTGGGSIPGHQIHPSVGQAGHLPGAVLEPDLRAHLNAPPTRDGRTVPAHLACCSRSCSASSSAGSGRPAETRVCSPSGRDRSADSRPLHSAW